MSLRSLVPLIALFGCNTATIEELAAENDTLRDDLGALQAELDTLRASVETNAADLDALTGEENLTDIRVRVEALEAAGDETSEDLDNIETSLTEALETQSNQGADIAANTAGVATNAAAIAVNASDIDTNADGVSANRGDIATNAADIRANTSDIASNTAGIAGNASDIGTNASGISANASASSSNASSISSNRASITSNRSRIGSLETDVAAAEADITSLESDLSTADKDLVDLTDDVELLQTYAEVHVSTTTGGETGADSGIVRSMSFTKAEAATRLHISYSDNWRQYRHGAACMWEILVDDRPCSSPSALRYTYYTAGSDGAWHNHHRMGSVEGVCDATSAGAIGTGSHTIKVRVSAAPGYSSRDCHTGWNSNTYAMMVREIPK